MNIQQQSSLTGQEQGYWFVSQNGRLWLPNGELPCGMAKDFGFTGLQAQPIGEWAGQIAWLICKEMKNSMGSIRPLLNSSDQALFLLAGRAVQLSDFYRSHKYCGYCGHTCI